MAFFNKSKNQNQIADMENFDENDIEALICELECGNNNSSTEKTMNSVKNKDNVGSKPPCSFSTYASDTSKASKSPQSKDYLHGTDDSGRRLYSHPAPRVLAGGQRLAPITHGDSNKKHHSKPSGKDTSSVTQPSAAGVQELLALATRQATQYSTGDLSGQPDVSASEGYDHYNFLPVMHAEKLERDHNLTGILPRPRWGHTFVAIEDNGSHVCNASGGTAASGSVASLVLFGGTVTSEKAGDREEGETNDLFEFRVATQSWEPLYTKGSSHLAGDPPSANRKAGVSQHRNAGKSLYPSSIHISHHSNLPASMVPPAKRTMHSAVSYLNRYLLVFGGTADHGTTLYNDVHSYDMVTRQWCHLGAESYIHEPSGRFGHTAVVHLNRMIVFGGKCARREESANASSVTSKNTHLSNDVLIFDLSRNSWRKRVGVPCASDKKKIKKKTASSETGENEEHGHNTAEAADADGPCKRFHHSATVLGGDMYIHGGEAADGTILSDTWAFNLERKEWRLVHCGGLAAPRSRHYLYGCGEALLALGGISPIHHQRCLRDSSLAVLPVLQRITVDGEGDVLCPIPEDVVQWIPVTVSSTDVIPFSKKNFGATAHGGFIYTFGGLNSPTEAANNSLVRCLSMDGIPLPADIPESSRQQLNTLQRTRGAYYPVRSLRQSELGLLTRRMTRLLEDTTFLDIYISLPPSLGATNGSCFGAHSLILLIRAPLFYEKVLQCAEVVLDQCFSGEVSIATTLASFGSQSRDGVSETDKNINSNNSHIPCYNIASRSNRAQGLKVAFTPDALRSFLYFLYTGSIVTSMDTKTNMDEEDDEDVLQDNDNAVLDLLDEIAKEYQIPSLSTAVICRSHVTPSSRQRSPSPGLLKTANKPTDTAVQSKVMLRFGETCRLSDEFAELLGSGVHATATMLFIDPHTKVQSTRVVHPLILINASNVFRNLLKPLLSTHMDSNTQGGTTIVTTNTFAGITAKKKGTTGLSSLQAVNKRSIIIGPVVIPTMSIDTVLSYLYTASLNIHPEAALPTLMAAHTLGLTELQGQCESIVGREEVNYTTSISYLLLAETHGARLLGELALLTSALGLDEAIGDDSPAGCDGYTQQQQQQQHVKRSGGAGYSDNISEGGRQGSVPQGISNYTLRNSSAFLNLPMVLKERIEKISKTLKGKWVAPSSPERTAATGLADQKSPEYYAAMGCAKW